MHSARTWVLVVAARLVPVVERYFVRMSHGSPENAGAPEAVGLPMFGKPSSTGANSSPDRRRAHRLLVAAAHTEAVHDRPVDVGLPGREAADGGVVGSPAGHRHVQFLDEGKVLEDRDQHLDEAFHDICRASEAGRRVEARDVVAGESGCRVSGAGGSRQVGSGAGIGSRRDAGLHRDRGRQRAVRQEIECVFTVAHADRGADFSGRQFEQAALGGEFDVALLVDGEVLRGPADEGPAGLRQARFAEPVEAAGAE